MHWMTGFISIFCMGNNYLFIQIDLNRERMGRLMTICGLINSHVIYNIVGKVLKLCIYPSARQTE